MLENRQIKLADAELRIMRDDHGTRTLEGYAAKFGVLSNELPGKFRERIDPAAFGRINGADVRAVIDHDTSRLLGRTKSGTLELVVDERGLRYRVRSLPDTSYARDLEEQIKRGDVDGCSFAFRCVKDKWTVEDGVSVRTLLDVDLVDVCPTSSPCYPDTEVAVRSMTAWQEAQKPPGRNWRECKQRASEEFRGSPDQPRDEKGRFSSEGGGIQNPNSSGQGYSSAHLDNPHHDTITKAGYEYSHSTEIHKQDGSSYLHHTYTHPEFKDEHVGVSGDKWMVSKGGSGHQYEGKSSEKLGAFLKGRLGRLSSKSQS